MAYQEPAAPQSAPQQTPAPQPQAQAQQQHTGPQSAHAALASASPLVAQAKAYQALADASPAVQRITQLQAQANAATPPIIQRRANHTGLPDQLKSGVESLSGISMDDVKVHYNSQKPAQLQALAYAQGTDIHIGPGQEQHLAHEAWHVVQQKQNRVPETAQLKGIGINDDAGLEREADVMGAKALQMKAVEGGLASTSTNSGMIQRKVVQRFIDYNGRENGLPPFGRHGLYIRIGYAIFFRDLLGRTTYVGTQDEVIENRIDLHGDDSASQDGSQSESESEAEEEVADRVRKKVKVAPASPPLAPVIADEEPEDADSESGGSGYEEEEDEDADDEQGYGTEEDENAAYNSAEEEEDDPLMALTGADFLQDWDEDAAHPEEESEESSSESEEEAASPPKAKKDDITIPLVPDDTPEVSAKATEDHYKGLIKKAIKGAQDEFEKDSSDSDLESDNEFLRKRSIAGSQYRKNRKAQKVAEIEAIIKTALPVSEQEEAEIEALRAARQADHKTRKGMRGIYSKETMKMYAKRAKEMMATSLLHNTYLRRAARAAIPKAERIKSTSAKYDQSQGKIRTKLMDIIKNDAGKMGFKAEDFSSKGMWQAFQWMLANTWSNDPKKKERLDPQSSTALGTDFTPRAAFHHVFWKESMGEESAEFALNPANLTLRQDDRERTGKKKNTAGLPKPGNHEFDHQLFGFKTTDASWAGSRFKKGGHFKAIDLEATLIAVSMLSQPRKPKREAIADLSATSEPEDEFADIDDEELRQMLHLVMIGEHDRDATNYTDLESDIVGLGSIRQNDNECGQMSAFNAMALLDVHSSMDDLLENAEDRAAFEQQYMDRDHLEQLGFFENMADEMAVVDMLHNQEQDEIVVVNNLAQMQVFVNQIRDNGQDHFRLTYGDAIADAHLTRIQALDDFLTGQSDRVVFVLHTHAAHAPAPVISKAKKADTSASSTTTSATAATTTSAPLPVPKTASTPLPVASTSSATLTASTKAPTTASSTAKAPKKGRRGPAHWIAVRVDRRENGSLGITFMDSLHQAGTYTRLLNSLRIMLQGLENIPAVEEDAEEED